MGIQVVRVHQEILAYLAGLANRVLLVALVDVFLVIVDSLEQMVNQEKMELMADQVHRGLLEILLALRILPVQFLLLT